MKFFTFIKTLMLILIGINVISLEAAEIQVSSVKTQLVINSKSDTKISLSSTIGNISSSMIQHENNDYVILETATYTKSEKIGYPSLPVLRKLMEIPQGANPKVEILSYDIKEFQLGELGITNPIYPCQGPLSKCADEEIFQIDNNIYETNGFVKEEMVRFEVVGTMRSQRLGLVVISPFEYNPVTNVLRVFENINFEIVFENADFAKTQEIKSNTFSPYFSGMQSNILNYIPESSRANLTQYPIKYVIVSDPMFTDNLQPLVDWKKRKGFDVVEAYTDEIGTTKEAIKTYIQGLYDAGTTENPAPSFILFIGDLNTMPTWNNGDGVTDRNYVEYTGDLLPEIFYGRMSAENTAQLDVIIGKTLQYEQFTMPDPSYLDEVLLVSGVDGSYAPNWGNGQINYGTINYFNEDHGITSHTYLYPESGSSAAVIKQDISNGVTFANYTAHCSPNGWADPSVGISDIANFTNQDKYGLMIGNCCSSSEFQTDCFAEEVVRAENKGAVGYIGGSNSTYWDEDYYFGVGVGTINQDPPAYEETTLGNYDRQFHDNGEPFSEWYTTMDQVIFAGNLAVLESGSSRAQYYWDIYNLIGDPSLMVYFTVPEEMPVSHAGLITIGQSTFTVETEPYAYAAINRDGVTLSVGLADENGVLELNTEGFTPGNVELVITAQNRQPYIEELLVFTPNGAYISFESYTIDDELLGNGNGMAEFNEIVLFNVSLKNFGTVDANAVNAVISSESEYITILENTMNFGTVAVDQIVLVEDAFKVQLSNNVPDQEQIVFVIEMTDENDSTWTSTFNLTANGPLMVADELTIDDSDTGNGNGRLDPGEDAIFTIKVLNNGHCNIDEVTASIEAVNAYVTIESDAVVIPLLDMTIPSYVSFNVSVAADAPVGVFAEMHFELSGAGYDAFANYYPKIGEIIEDWETGDFTKFDWQNEGTSPWEIVTTDPFEGTYCAASGSIGDNQSTEFEIEYEVMGSNTIKFFKKVSTESNYDYLRFYIDNNVQGEWSGTVAWSEEEYDVTAGVHTFKWVYEKDYSTTSGSDKVWVDYISLPTMMATTLYAGADTETCGSSDFICQGSATNYATIWWETSGTGSFNDINVVKPIYTPSEQDIIDGEVVLTLSITDDSKATFSDSMTLALKDVPETANQPSGTASVDLEEEPSSDYSTSIVEGANSYNWVIYPEYAGTFANNTENTTINWNLDFEGEVWIKVSAENTCGQGDFSDSLQVILSNPVGIISASEKINLNLMPNPNNGVFDIVIETNETEYLDLTIVNNLGQTVLSSKIIAEGSHTETINISGIKSGIYMIMLKGNKIQAMKKMLIK